MKVNSSRDPSITHRAAKFHRFICHRDLLQKDCAVRMSLTSSNYDVTIFGDPHGIQVADIETVGQDTLLELLKPLRSIF